jgi:signal transduction histidine kinase
MLMYFEAKTQNGDFVSESIRKIDSLKNILADRSLDERRQLEIYVVITEYYSSFDPDSVIVYAPKAISLAERLNEKALAQNTYCHLGTAHCFKCNYEASLFYLDKAQQLAIEMKNKLAEAKAIGQIAYMYSHQGKYITAIDLSLDVLAIQESLGNTVNQVFVLASLCELNRKLGNTDIALRYLDEADRLCGILTGFGYTWRKSKIYNEYATVYFSENNIEKALEYALKSDSIEGGVINNCIAKVLLSKMYLRLNDYERALQHANEAMTQANILKSGNLYIEVLTVLSEIYMAQQHYPEAETEALKVWRIDSTNINESRIAAANIALANIYMQNADRASYYFNKNVELNDLYSEKSFHITVSDLSVKYELEKKEILLLSMKRQRLLYMTISAIGFLFALSGWLVFRLQMRREQTEKQLVAVHAIIEGENEERARAARELNEGLVKMIASAKTELDNTVDYSQNIGKKFDDCIEEIHRIVAGMRPDLLNRFGLKVALEDYCRRLPDVRFFFSGDEKRITEKIADTIYYCASELVNNALKHSGATDIEVRLIQNNACVSLTVQDNGLGFDKKTVVKGSGLKNINYRVTAFNGAVDISSSPDAGTKVIIKFKIETN